MPPPTSTWLSPSTPPATPPSSLLSPEHLIVYKLIAGRPRDFDDTAEVLRTRALAREPVDEALIRRWAVDWSIEDRLEHLLAAVRSA